jgi:hypothetical protein
MAATATQQIINNGPRNLVLKYTIAGTSGDVTAADLVDVSSLDSTIGNNGLKLMGAQWSLSGFSCNLLWEGGPNVNLLELTSGEGEIDLSDIGGVVNNATDQSGDVLFTTTDYGASGEGGHIVLHFKKRNSSEDLTDVSPAAASLGLTGQTPTRVVA